MGDGLDKDKARVPEATQSGPDSAHLYSGFFTSAMKATSHPQTADGAHSLSEKRLDTIAVTPESKREAKPEAKPESKPENIVDTPENARERLSYLQTTLTNFLPAIYARAESAAPRADLPKAGTPGANTPESNTPDTGARLAGEPEPVAASAVVPKSAEQIAAVKAQLAAEQAGGVFGEATRAVYGDYLRWLQDTALPAQVAKNKALGLPVEPKGNFSVDEAGKTVLSMPAGRAPSDSEMEHLDGAARWLQSNAAVSSQREEVLAKTIGDNIEKTVRELGLPRPWIEGREKDTRLWLQNSGRLLDTALSLRQDIEQQDEINKSIGGGFPAELPPGATVERDKNGKIVKLDLGLPDSWRLDKPGDIERLSALEAWHAERKAEIDPVNAQLKEMRFMPELTVGRGEMELKERVVRLDANGRVLAFTGDGGLQKPGQSEQHINLVQSGYTVSRENGKVTIKQTIQPQEVPRLGYLNEFGVKDVGKPLELTRQFNDNDLVLVRNGKDFSLVRARELQNDSYWQMARRAGDKLLPAAMDLGFVTVGAIELFGANRGDGLRRIAGGVLKKEAVAAGEVYTAEMAQAAARARLAQGLHGGVRVAVGGAGIFNNASARETSWGENLNTARSAYFLTDITYGLGKSGVALANRLRPSAATAAAAGTKAVESKIIGVTAGSTASRAYRVGQSALFASGIAYSPYIYGNLKDQVTMAITDQDRHLKRASDLSY